MIEVTADTLDTIGLAAASSPRRRQHFNLHHNYQDPSQRVLNVLCADSYIRPHRHTLDPKEEYLFAVRGAFAFISFEDNGDVATITPFATERYWRAGAPFGVSIAPTRWHTVIALSQEAALLETKAGPFNPDLAKEPAPWAPSEDDVPAGQAYLETLRESVMRSSLIWDQLTRSAFP